MKNKKFLSMILVVAMMLMGAGYAAWSQTFTVNATINTGELEMAVIDAVESSCDQMDYEECYMNGTQTFDDGTGIVTLTVNNMYPGSSYGADYTFKNVGTVGTKLSPQALADSFELKEFPADEGFVVADTKIEGSHVTITLENGIQICAIYSLGGCPLEKVCKWNWWTFSCDCEYEEVCDVCHFDGIVGLEESAHLTVGVIMPCSIGTEEDPDQLENSTFKFSFLPTFTQFNSDEQ